jgi:hypothetical protein
MGVPGVMAHKATATVLFTSVQSNQIWTKDNDEILLTYYRDNPVSLPVQGTLLVGWKAA